MIKKIIIFLPSFESGGVERNAVYFANGLASHGFDVHLFYCRESSKWFSELDKRVQRVKIIRIPLALILHDRLVDALSMLIFSLPKIKLVRDSCPTAIISFQSNIIAILLSHIAKVRIAVRISNHFDAAQHENSLLRKLSEVGKRWTYRFADIVIANSRELADEYQPILKKRVGTIFNPVDFKSIDHLKQLEVTDDIFVRKSRPIVISAGRLTSQKNYVLLLNAMALVMKSHACDLVILGEGEQKEQLIQLSNDLGIEKSVHFLGYKDNIYKYFAQSDLFVLSSNYEGMPNVLIEALACGLPAVSTRCKTGPSEILCDGEGGELITPGNCKSLADGILQSLNRPDIARMKCQIAQNNLLRFDLNMVNNDYIQLANNLLSENFP